MPDFNGLKQTIKEEEGRTRKYGQEYLDADYKVREMEGKLEDFIREMEHALGEYLTSVGLDIHDIAFGGLAQVILAAAKAGWNAAGLLEQHTRLNLMRTRDLPSAKTLRDNKKYLLDKAEESLARYQRQQREKCL